MIKKQDWLTYVLVGLVIVGAYMLGVYKTRYDLMVKGDKQEGKGGQQVQPQQEKQKTSLSKEEWKAVLANPGAEMGEKKAKVTMVEFTDYQCPFCQRYFQETFEKIKKNYVETGKVRYIVHDLPLPFHRNAKVAAMAARCAGEKGKYWEMHDKLFEKQGEWQGLSQEEAVKKFSEYGRELGIEIAACQKSEKVKKAVEEDLKLAQKMGANGTPTFFINGKLLVGAQPYESFEALIKEVLK